MNTTNKQGHKTDSTAERDWTDTERKLLGELSSYVRGLDREADIAEFKSDRQDPIFHISIPELDKESDLGAFGSLSKYDGSLYVLQNHMDREAMEADSLEPLVHEARKVAERHCRAA
jgi:hypothetical protein